MAGPSHVVCEVFEWLEDFCSRGYSALLWMTWRTMLRLELGLPADLIELAETVTTQLTRPQWLRLRAAGVTTIAAAEKTSLADLTTVLGSEQAATTLQRE